MTKDMKALSLRTAISKNKRIIPNITIRRGIEVFFMIGIDKAKLKIKTSKENIRRQKGRSCRRIAI